MGFNLLVWKWASDFDTGAKRKKAKLKYADVTRGFADGERHPAMAEHDFAEFERRLVATLGSERPDGAYLLERHARARVVDLPSSRARELVPVIGGIARGCGLTSGEC